MKGSSSSNCRSSATAEAPYRETQPADPPEQNNTRKSITMTVATAILLVGAIVSVASLNVDSDTVDYAVELIKKNITKICLQNVQKIY